ncbi:hypothetical protein [Actinosynnema sp. NPDC020468]|uniref:hypothetical protein n=1 Tax=Actinosynnema sp. NPDC020468 TaxID=3154488 RepID=UPI00340CC569
MRESAGRVRAIARDLFARLAERGGDLAADFTARYPPAAPLDLLGVPPHHLEDALDVCRRVLDPVGELRHGPGGILGRRLTTLRVRLDNP